MITRPPRPAPGDLIAVVAPSNEVASRQDALRRGVRRLESLGFRVRLGRSCFLRDGPLAGSAEERLRDLHAAWADPEVRAIVAATGGFGCAPLVDRLDYDLIRRRPKVVMGMSDVSILVLAVHARTGLVTPEPAGPLPQWAGPAWVLRRGTARGRLIAGNLPCIGHLLGTPYWADLTGAIVCLEAVGLSSVALMRWLVHLRLAGGLDRAGALVFGHLERCCTDRPAPDEGLAWAVAHALPDARLPVFQIEGFGHMVPNVTLPMGCLASVDGDGLRIEEAAVA